MKYILARYLYLSQAMVKYASTEQFWKTGKMNLI